ELEAEWLPLPRCRELEPGLTPSFHGGVFAAGEAAVDPRLLTRALVAACAGEGVEIRPACEVIGSNLAQGRIVGVRVETRGGCAGRYYTFTESGGDFHAETVVLACGAWAGAAEWLPEEARPSVRPVKGQVVELRGRTEEPAAHHILSSEHVYLVPRPDGRLIVGATVEEMGFDTAVTAGGIHELLREAYRLLPDVAEMEFAGATAGLRPGTPDNLPVVGPGAIEGLVLATGHFRNGILLAPLAAETIADLLAADRRSSFVRRTDNKGRTPAGLEAAR
ncbi:MAG TPA: FAD-dependent oxidoreductase, partial [Solirubrobacterales bacterium]|nr:FAD-dependent oxidoreductase [Solirubrobacterales bacterium]